MRFALNHITTPRLSVEDFFASARKLGITEVEVRNDLPDVVGTVAPGAGQGRGREGGRRDHLDQRALSVQRLVGRPAGAGGGARRLRQGRRREGARHVPAQRRHARVARRPRGGAEGDGADPARARADRPRRAARLPDLVDAHQEAGRRRRSTRRAARDVYRLVHDTFHHHLAGETEFFPERTGIVHISGVVDPDVAVDEMLDPHRVLVDDADRLENVPQIRRARRPRLRRPVQLRAVRAGGAGAGRSGGRAPREHGARDRGADGADRGLRPGRQVRRSGKRGLT